MTSSSACHARVAVPGLRAAAAHLVDDLDAAFELIAAKRPRGTLDVSAKACDGHATAAGTAVPDNPDAGRGDSPAA